MMVVEAYYIKMALVKFKLKAFEYASDFLQTFPTMLTP